MPTYRTFALTLAPLLASVALALPGAASATTFCVNAHDCPADGVTVEDGAADGGLQAALDFAAKNPVGNLVLVGDKGSPYVGPFSYEAGPVDGLNTVTISADGGRPVLTDAAGAGGTVLSLDGATLAGIDVVMPQATEGVGVQTGNATLRDVTVSSARGGPGATAIQDTGQTVLDHVRVTASGEVGVQVGSDLERIVGLPAINVTAQNLVVSNAEVGVAVGISGSLRATQSQFTAKAVGLSAHGAADLDRVVVATTNPDSTGISQSNAGVSLEHVTVAHEGPEDAIDTALSLRAADADPTVRIAHSALAGYTHGIARTVAGGHTVSIEALESVWNDAGDQLGDASAGPVREVGDVHVEPALVNPAAGDFRPRGSSAQIDLDTTADPSTYTDLVGTPAVDGKGDGIARPDAGALEYRRQLPSIDALETPAAGASGGQLLFSSSVTDADGDHLQVSWDFGDGSSAAGTDVSHTYAAPGTYQGTLTATNESGLAASRTFIVTISPGGSTGGTPTPPTTLVLSSLRLSSRRISVKRAGSLRLRFDANEAATVRIVLTRRIAGRTVTAAALVRHAGAGEDSIVLGAALRKLHLLKPGRLTLTVTAGDASGNHTQPRALRLTLVR